MRASLLSLFSVFCFLFLISVSVVCFPFSISVFCFLFLLSVFRFLFSSYHSLKSCPVVMSVDPSHGNIRVSLEKQSTHCSQTVQLTVRLMISLFLFWTLDMRQGNEKLEIRVK